MRLAAIVSKLAVAVAAAVPVAPRPAAAQAASLRTERLADGVYAIVRSTRPGDPSDANTTIIVNDDDVVVVDANITPSSTRAVIAELRRLTSKPVRYVINTHVHSDHVYGNVTYAAAYPGVEFIAHAATRDDYVRDDSIALVRNLTTDYPASLRQYRDAIARGTAADGRRYSPRELDAFRQQVGVLEWFIAEMQGFTHRAPTLTLTDSLVLHRGKRRIVVRHLGRANTRGDVIVYLPEERIVAAGDMVVSPIPFAWNSFPSDWVRSLERLRALPMVALVPGHGEVQRDWRYVERLTSVFTAALAETRATVARDTSLAAAKGRVTLASFRGDFIGSDSTRGRAFDVFADALVGRAWLDVRGKLP